MTNSPSPSLEELRVQAEYFAQIAKITYDKISFKKNGLVVYKQESGEFGEGIPATVIPVHMVKTIIEHHNRLLDEIKGELPKPLNLPDQSEYTEAELCDKHYERAWNSALFEAKKVLESKRLP